ncbi:hypothetical protein HDV05_001534 [Chytridiales sp. JEL 0842]|nr:hypothetical protein HDV05_001534 [Chytridiales sp. JEL 0842]
MITIKACLAKSPSTFRKFTIPLSKTDSDFLLSTSEGAEGHLFGYDALLMKVRAVFELEDWAATLFYLDDEGDWIAMSSPEEFAEAVKCLPTSSAALKVKVNVGQGSRKRRLNSVDVQQQQEGNDTAQPAEHLSSSMSQRVTAQGSTAEEFLNSVKEQSPPRIDEKSGPSTTSGEVVDGFGVFMNEFHCHRLIVQTAVTEGIRSLFENPTSDVNGLDYAINEILYGRTILISAIEEALGLNKRQQASSSSSERGEEVPQDAYEWKERHRAAMEALKEGLKSTAHVAGNISASVVQSLRSFAHDLQASWNANSAASGASPSGSNASGPSQDLPRPPPGAYTPHPHPNDPLLNPEAFDALQNDLKKSVKFALEMVGLVTTGLTNIMVEVGHRVMTEQDPFSGVFDGVPEELYTFRPSSEEEDDEEPLVKKGKEREDVEKSECAMENAGGVSERQTEPLSDHMTQSLEQAFTDELAMYTELGVIQDETAPLISPPATSTGMTDSMVSNAERGGEEELSASYYSSVDGETQASKTSQQQLYPQLGDLVSLDIPTTSSTASTISELVEDEDVSPSQELYMSILTSSSLSTTHADAVAGAAHTPALSVEVMHPDDVFSESDMSQVPDVGGLSDAGESSPVDEGDFILVDEEEEEGGEDGEEGDLRSSTLIFPVL